MNRKLARILKFVFIFVLVFAWIFSGWPRVWQNPPIPPKIQEARAETAGPFYTGTGANYNDGGNVAWTNPTNIQGDTTDTAATASPNGLNNTSQRLRASNFGFEIPSGSTITGIKVGVEQFAGFSNRHRWNSVKLLIAGSETGSDYSDGSIIAKSKVFKEFGSDVLLWGLTPTAEQINASGFGVSFKIDQYGSLATTTSLYRARITVYYTLPSVPPTVETGSADPVEETTATLNGNLTSLGTYSPVYVYFQYGETEGYGTNTSEQEKTGTGTFNQAISSLSKGTFYNFRAAARYNSSYVYGNNATFLTKPDEPTSFTATPGDQQNTLNWNKGTGAGRTLIRFSTIDYPATIADGNQIYFNTGNSFVHENLNNGTPYYYSAWSEMTSGALQQYSDAKATATGTPGVVYSVIITSPDPPTISYGALPLGTGGTKTSITITAQVGDAATKLTIRGDDAIYEEVGKCGDNTCAWTLSSARGEDEYVHAFTTKDPAPASGDTLGSNPANEWVALDKSGKVLAASVLANNSQDFKLDMRTPLTTNGETDYGSQYSTTVTIVASAPD